MHTSRKLKTFLSVLAVLALFAAGGAAYCYSIAQSPDFDVTMVRNIPSKLSVSYLDENIGTLKTWPSWFHAAEKADEVDFRGFPYPKSIQKVETRGLIRMTMDSHSPLKDHFDLTLLIEDYTPGKHLRMRVVSDSTHKLTALFDDIEWQIELVPQANGTDIRATITARTKTARSRILGKLVPNVILNQIFYPNLFVLAQINDPSVVFPDPEAQHGGM